MDKDGYKIGDITEQFMQLDYMTQRTIANEFPDFFGTWSPKQDTSNLEHFSDKRIISYQNIWLGLCIAIAVITFLAYGLEWLEKVL